MLFRATASHLRRAKAIQIQEVERLGRLLELVVLRPGATQLFEVERLEKVLVLMVLRSAATQFPVVERIKCLSVSSTTLYLGLERRHLKWWLNSLF